MTDHFSLFNEPRRLWLEPELLKEKFFVLSNSVHPDRVHHLGEAERAAAQEHYVALNAAYQCLREPRSRLRHWLELERGIGPGDIQHVPADLMTLFFAVGDVLKRSDLMLAEKAKTTSPLMKVQWFEKSQDLVGSLQRVMLTIAQRREQLIETLKQIDDECAAAPLVAENRSLLLRKVGQLHQLFAYYDRWLSQIQEHIARLSF